MSRASIIMLLLLALGGAGGGTYFLVFPRVSAVVQDETRDGLQTAARLVYRIERDEQAKLLSGMMAASRRTKLVNLLASKPTASGQLKQWLDDLRVEIAAVTASARNFATVSDMFVLDTNGKGLVRNVDMHWTGKSPSEDHAVAEIVQKACKGKTGIAIIDQRDGVSRVVAVPINHNGKSSGVLLGFFPLDATEIRFRKSYIESDVDIALIGDGKIVASSLKNGRLAKVEAYVKNHDDGLAKILSADPSHPRVLDSTGMGAYLAGISLAPENKDAHARLGMLLVRWTDSIVGPMNEIALYLFVGMGLLFVFLSLLVVMIGGGLSRSLKTMEEELLDMVNSGQMRTIRSTGPALVKSIAHLFSQLLDHGDSGPEERAEELKQMVSMDDIVTVDENEDSNGLVEHKEHDTTEDDPLSEYYTALYSEFCSAKEELGERVKRLDLTRFRNKLEKQKKKIKSKHSCKDVRFEVMVKSGKVSLQPKILR